MSVTLNYVWNASLSLDLLPLSCSSPFLSSNSTLQILPFPPSAMAWNKSGRGFNRYGEHAGSVQNHWMLPLPLLALPSVPLVSDDSALLSELRLASQGMASRRGGIRSLMRSRPLASAKLLILCWGEKPLIAGVGGKKHGVISQYLTQCLKITWLFYKVWLW